MSEQVFSSTPYSKRWRSTGRLFSHVCRGLPTLPAVRPHLGDADIASSLPKRPIGLVYQHLNPVRRLECLRANFSGSYPHGFTHVTDEDFAVTNLAGSC